MDTETKSVLSAIEQSQPTDLIKFVCHPRLFIESNKHMEASDIENVIGSIYSMAQPAPRNIDDPNVQLYLEILFKTRQIGCNLPCIQRYISFKSQHGLENFHIFRRWYISEYIAKTNKWRSTLSRTKTVWINALKRINLDEYGVREAHKYQGIKDEGSPFWTALYAVHQRVLEIIDEDYHTAMRHSPVRDHTSMLRELAKQYLWYGNVPVFDNPVSHSSIDDAVQNGLDDSDFYHPVGGFAIFRRTSNVYYALHMNANIWGTSRICVFAANKDGSFTKMDPS